jgi:vacuolar-type H+-ATPase subunit H
VRQEVEDEEEVPAQAEEEDEEEEAGGNRAEPEEEGEASLDEILAKKPDHAEDDDESILAMGRDDRSETLSVKVEPKKDTEFVCRKCHLVKPIRSQLVDKARMLCRDCA